MAGDEGIELVGNDVEAQNPEKMGGDEEADEKKPEGMAFMTKAILLVGLVAAVVNAVAIVVEGSMIMIIAGGISIVVALAVMKFQLDLGDPDGELAELWFWNHQRNTADAFLSFCVREPARKRVKNVSHFGCVPERNSGSASECFSPQASRAPCHHRTVFV